MVMLIFCKFDSGQIPGVEPPVCVQGGALAVQLFPSAAATPRAARTIELKSAVKLSKSTKNYLH